MSYFEKITPVNGFDASNRDNARQNNYAWSIGEFGEYLYVGTGRNIVYSVLNNLLPEILPGFDIEVPEEFTPNVLDMRAEIWRYPKNGKGKWERAFKAPQGIYGFRFMIQYRGALIVGCSTFGDTIALVRFDGRHWEVIQTDIPGTSTRAMVEHKGRLYMAVIQSEINEEEPLLYSTVCPRGEWEREDTDKLNGSGYVLASFNGHLYMGTGRASGFELWRTVGGTPESGWKRVIDAGAGDARNEIPLSLTEFNHHLYVGTAIIFGVVSLNPKDRLVLPKGGDIIRINKKDDWEVVVGSAPAVPTNPKTGVRNPALSGLPSGFGNPANGYIWNLHEHNGELYAGTWDWSDLVPPLLQEVAAAYFARNPLLRRLPIELLLELLFMRLKPLTNLFFGFDLWKSADGIHWTPVTVNGFGNPDNYGARTMFTSKNGNLYLGTANPFEGCEVWEKEGKRPYHHPADPKECEWE